MKAIRAFESTARLRSFSKAAEELHVTQAAISHQVKSLEANLSAVLFYRAGNRVTLTEDGEKLFAAATNGLHMIGSAVHHIRLRQEQMPMPFVLSVTPSFAHQWLIPKLDGFRKACPNINLHIQHSTTLADLKAGTADAAIRGGNGNWPGLCAEYLLPLEFAPICHSRLLQGEFPLTDPNNLRHHTLLHNTNYDEWQRYLQHTKHTQVDCETGMVLDDAHSLMLAVLSAQGVALGRVGLLHEYFAIKELVQVGESIYRDSLGYYFAYIKENSNLPAIKCFRQFLLDNLST